MRAPVVALLAGCALALAAAAPAAAEEEEDRKPKTKAVQTVDEWSYEKLQQAHDLMAEEQYDEARGLMDQMRQRQGLNEHEKALLWQTYGYIHTSQERYRQATEAFEKCLSFDALPEGSDLSTRYNLGQLYMVLERYDEAIATLEEWLSRTGSPAPNALYLLGTAYAQKGSWEKALSYARRAIDEAKQPRESWYQLVLACHFELKQYRQVAEVLKKLVELRPDKKTYWVQLASAWSELGEEKKALATLEVAYRNELLDQSGEIRNLAEMYLYHGVPYKAAQVVERGLEEEILEPDVDNLELLANAWMHAREWDAALGPLTRAAELSDKGDLWVRLGQVYVEREEWDRARRALDRALAKGDLSDPGNAQLLSGVANLNAERRGAAKRAFEQASRFDETRQSARRWLRYLESEERRS